MDAEAEEEPWKLVFKKMEQLISVFNISSSLFKIKTA